MVGLQGWVLVSTNLMHGPSAEFQFQICLFLSQEGPSGHPRTNKIQDVMKEQNDQWS